MSQRSLSYRVTSLAATAALVLLAAACSDRGGSVAGPDDIGARASGGSLSDPHVTVCVDAESPSGTYEYDRSADTDFGTFFVSSPFSLSPDGCVDVWQDDGATGSSDEPTDVTVDETDTPDGAVLDEIEITGETIDATTSESSATVTVNQFHGATITFVYGMGGQGCTPGYWKQPQHSDSWEGHAPDDLLGSVFTLPSSLSLQKPEKADPDDLTLLQGLDLRGGGVNALIRHAVAGLLNASNDDVSYDLTESEVISMFNDAVDGGDVEGTKDRLVEFNQQGCPLD